MIPPERRGPPQISVLKTEISGREPVGPRSGVASEIIGQAMAAARRAAAGRARDAGEARDVLAAEEFGVPAADPGLHRDEARDVLAAEEFAVPAPSLHAGPVLLPDDPTGIPEPHDVLAAEEFALPAPPPSTHVPADRERPRTPRAGYVVLGAALVLATRRALRRR